MTNGVVWGQPITDTNRITDLLKTLEVETVQYWIISPYVPLDSMDFVYFDVYDSSYGITGKELSADEVEIHPEGYTTTITVD